MMVLNTRTIISSLFTWGVVALSSEKACVWAFDNLDYAVHDTLDLLDIRGASIAFFDNNTMTEPIVRGYGRVATSDNSPKVRKDTAFMIASVSKVFAGAAVMILVDQGVISLDEDICNVVPSDWDRSACRNPKFPEIPVTWRMLVTHRSSLREGVPYLNDEFGDYVEASYGPTGGYDGMAAGQATCPMEDVVGFYRDILIDKESETSVGSDLNVNWYQLAQRSGGAWRNEKPGTRVVYSNFAVGYIAALVELTTGQSFPDFCRANIFEPLEMSRTAWFRRDLPEDTLEAVPVEANRRGKFRDIGHYCFIDYASGSLRTTAEDLAKFLQTMLNFGVPLWSEAIGRQSVGCLERDESGAPPQRCEFGANWIRLDNAQKDNSDEWLDPFLGLDWTDGVHHDGAEFGSQTQIIVLPSAGVFAVVLTNTDGNDEDAAQMTAWEMMWELGYSAAVQPVASWKAWLLTLSSIIFYL